MAAQGWYPDPAGAAGAFRYWDGATWSREVSFDPAHAAVPGAAPVVPEAPTMSQVSAESPVSPPYLEGAPVGPATAGLTGYPAWPTQPVSPAPSPYGGQPAPMPYPGGPSQPWAGRPATGYGTPYGAPPPASSNNLPFIIIAAIIGVGLIVGGIWWFTRDRSTPPAPPPATTTRTQGPTTPTSAPPTTTRPPGQVVTNTYRPDEGTPGSVWAWGSYGLGIGEEYPQPDRPVTAALVDIVQVSGGDGSGLALDADGVVWAWGSNYDGQLGVDDERAGNYPVAVPGLPPVKSVTSGDGAAFAVDEDGNVWAWGRNYQGRLGDGTNTSYTRTTPEQIEGPTDVVQVAASYTNGFALTSDGEVWAWGEGYTAGLDVRGTVAPTKIPGFTDVVQIDATWMFAAAVKSDGTVWGWGSTYSGELCRGEQNYWDGNTPTQMNVPPAAQVATGEDFTIVALKDGTVVACGDNDKGQLGDGTTNESNTAVTVSGLADIVAISAGRASGYALDAAGEVWAWGDNGSRQLGDGTTMLRYEPVRLEAFSGITAVEAGDSNAFAIQG